MYMYSRTERCACPLYTVCVVFLQLCCVRLVGIMLLVYIKESYWSHTTDVEVDTVKTGAGGIMVSVVALQGSLCSYPISAWCRATKEE